MKKYIFPVIAILTLIICFLVIQQSKKQHSSIIKNFDQKLKGLNQQNKEYEAKYSNYKKVSDSLKTKFNKSDFELKNQISQNQFLKSRLRSLVDSKGFSDTNKSIVMRDSIKDIAIQLIQSSTISDSICLDQIDRLESLSDIQEKQITYCDSLYKQTMLALKSSLENNQASDLENRALKKQIKRKKLLVKIEAVAILITATILTTTLLNH